MDSIELEKQAKEKEFPTFNANSQSAVFINMDKKAHDILGPRRSLSKDMQVDSKLKHDLHAIGFFKAADDNHTKFKPKLNIFQKNALKQKEEHEQMLEFLKKFRKRLSKSMVVKKEKEK